MYWYMLWILVNSRKLSIKVIMQEFLFVGNANYLNSFDQNVFFILVGFPYGSVFYQAFGRAYPFVILGVLLLIAAGNHFTLCTYLSSLREWSLFLGEVFFFKTCPPWKSQTTT